MPYLRCPRCGLYTYTAAYWSSVEYCGRCHAELPRPSRGSSPRERSRFIRETRPGADTPRVPSRSQSSRPGA